MKKFITLITAMCMVFTLVIPAQTQAATKVKLNKSKVTLTITSQKKRPTVQLKVTGTSKKVSWKSSNKKVATVSSKGKVTARKKGTAVIRAVVGKKTLKCRITVKTTICNKHTWKRGSYTRYDQIWVEDPDAPYMVTCYCGKYMTIEEWEKHSLEGLKKELETHEPNLCFGYTALAQQGGHYEDVTRKITYQYCTRCNASKY